MKAKLSAVGLTFVDKLPSLSSSLDVEIADASFLVQARQAVRVLRIAG